jgi:hypothetical protein
MALRQSHLTGGHRGVDHMGEERSLLEIVEGVDGELELRNAGGTPAALAGSRRVTTTSPVWVQRRLIQGVVRPVGAATCACA